MFPEDIQRLAQQIVATAGQRGLMLATAESCTGGLVAAALTAIPGSSAALDRGFVTYSNEAKMQMLDVPEAALLAHGAVSQATARAMAAGAVARSRADVTVAITGVAGPGGGTPMKPVGTVHIATARSNQALMHRSELFDGETRAEVQEMAVRSALQALRDRMV